MCVAPCLLFVLKYIRYGIQVDKTLGKKLAAGIEKGEELTEKTKETVGESRDAFVRLPNVRLSRLIPFFTTRRSKEEDPRNR